MNEFSLSGGAYIGNTKASKPFATLKVTSEVLQISVGFIGQYYFNAGNIIEIESASTLGGHGIRIIHNVPSYPKNVTFTTGTPYYNVIENIKATGFFDKTAQNQIQAYQVEKMQEQGRIPFKTTALIVFILGWNIPLFAGFIKGGINFAASYSIVSFLFVFLSAVLILFSPPFRTLVLKEGREINDMKKSLYFLLLIVTIGGIVFNVINRVPFNK